MGLVWRCDDRPMANFEATKMRTQLMVRNLAEEKVQRYDEHIRDMLANSVIEGAPDHVASQRLGETSSKEATSKRPPVTETAEEGKQAVRIRAAASSGIAPEPGRDPVYGEGPSNAFFLSIAACSIRTNSESFLMVLRGTDVAKASTITFSPVTIFC